MGLFKKFKAPNGKIERARESKIQRRIKASGTWLEEILKSGKSS